MRTPSASGHAALGVVQAWSSGLGGEARYRDHMASTGKIEAFLAEPRNIVVAGIRRDGTPHLSPNWFYWDGHRFYVSTTRHPDRYAPRHAAVRLLLSGSPGHGHRHQVPGVRAASGGSRHGRGRGGQGRPPGLAPTFICAHGARSWICATPSTPADRARGVTAAAAMVCFRLAVPVAEVCCQSRRGG